jgi:hypothetical protein
MSKSSETGHLRNVSNFAKLIDYVQSLGENYLPPKESIRIENLQSVYNASMSVMEDMAKANSDYTLAVDKRKLAYKPLGKLVTRIYNNLKASDTPEMIDESVRSIVRRLQGRRASALFTDEEKAALEAEGKSINQVSSSQMGYDTRLYNFDKFISLLSSIPEYKPSEADLKVEALQALYANIYMLNMASIKAASQLNKVRSRRTEAMYHPTNGLVALAQDVKSYLRSMGEPPDNLIKATLRIPFKNIN